MTCQKQYGVVNDWWIENDAFGGIEEPEKNAMMKAIKIWEKSERDKVLNDTV